MTVQETTRPCPFNNGTCNRRGCAGRNSCDAMSNLRSLPRAKDVRDTDPDWHDPPAPGCEDTVLGTGEPETLNTVAGETVDLRAPWRGEGWGSSGVVQDGGVGPARS